MPRYQLNGSSVVEALRRRHLKNVDAYDKLDLLFRGEERRLRKTILPASVILLL